MKRFLLALLFCATALTADDQAFAAQACATAVTSANQPSAYQVFKAALTANETPDQEDCVYLATYYHEYPGGPECGWQYHWCSSQLDRGGCTTHGVSYFNYFCCCNPPLCQAW